MVMTTAQKATYTRLGLTPTVLRALRLVNEARARLCMRPLRAHEGMTLSGLASELAALRSLTRDAGDGHKSLVDLVA